MAGAGGVLDQMVPCREGTGDPGCSLQHPRIRACQLYLLHAAGIRHSEGPAKQPPRVLRLGQDGQPPTRNLPILTPGN